MIERSWYAIRAVVGRHLMPWCVPTFFTLWLGAGAIGTWLVESGNQLGWIFTVYSMGIGGILFYFAGDLVDAQRQARRQRLRAR